MENGTIMGNGYGGVGFIVLVLLFWFFSKENEMPNGCCQDMSTQAASAVATQTTLNDAIRQQQEFCKITSGQYEQTEKTRDKLDAFRDEYQNNRYLDAKFASQKLETDNALLRQQLINQNQFNAINSNLAELSCNCLKRPPFYPYGCTPCPASAS